MADNHAKKNRLRFFQFSSATLVLLAFVVSMLASHVRQRRLIIEQTSKIEQLEEQLNKTTVATKPSVSLDDIFRADSSTTTEALAELEKILGQ